MRQALAAVIAGEEDLEVPWELSADDDIIAMTVKYHPDLVILDHALPDAATTGVLCAEICRALPGSRILVLIERRACAGLLPVLAHLTPQVGTISIEDSVPRLIDSVRKLMDGKFVVDVELAVAALNAGKNPLTQREKDVLRLALEGFPAKEIAARLYLSTGTVRNYLSKVLAKTGARTRIEAARRAQEAGWI